MVMDIGPCGPDRDYGPVMAGVGCRIGVPAAQIIELIAETFREADIAMDRLAVIGTHERKAGEPGLLAAAAHLGVPLRLFADLPDPTAPLPRHGFAPVAEMVAKSCGQLLVSKRKSAGATCALSLLGPICDVQSASLSAATASSMLATSTAGA